MKIIIAGVRKGVPWSVFKAGIETACARGFVFTEVVHGGAQGVDTMAGDWAAQWNIPVKVFPADWDNLGPVAGPIRNGDMAKYVGPAGGLLAFWDHQSRGTGDMIRKANLYKLHRIHIHSVPVAGYFDPAHFIQRKGL